MANVRSALLRLLPKGWWTRTLCAVFAVVLIPYLASRVGSLRNRVKIFQNQATSSTPRPSVPTLRIATYNIAHGRGPGDDNWRGGNSAQRSERLARIGDLLKDLDADIVILNEVDFDASWSNHVNQAEFLANYAGYPYRVEQRNLDFRILHYTWRFGNVVLSRYPIATAEIVDLPDESKWETLLAGKKRAVCCRVECPSGPITLIAAHLAHRSEDVRATSVKQILAGLEDSSLPTFFVGDLNSTPRGFPQWTATDEGHSALDLLDASQKFQRSRQREATSADLTYPAIDPETTIDWILIPKSWSFQSYQVIDTDLSDHRPIIAEVAP